MTVHTARALTRRRVLSSGLAAMGTAIIAPGLVRASPQNPSLATVTTMAFDGPAIITATPDGLLRRKDTDWTSLDVVRRYDLA